jgi:hypothetical protein
MLKNMQWLYFDRPCASIWRSHGESREWHTQRQDSKVEIRRPRAFAAKMPAPRAQCKFRHAAGTRFTPQWRTAYGGKGGGAAACAAAHGGA